MYSSLLKKARNDTNLLRVGVFGDVDEVLLLDEVHRLRARHSGVIRARAICGVNLRWLNM